MTYTIRVDTEIVVEDCCNCGVLFGMTSDYKRRMHESGEFFYCPNGHPQHYTKSDVQKLKEQLGEERRKHSQTQFELSVERNARSDTQAKLEKIKKRIKSGACPCCNRQFVQLARHMKTKHPEYQ